MASSTFDGIPPKITLYTNHACPWAHRVHIVLKELKLPYEEVIIDLGRPREEWYLKINPRGLVPTINYDNDVIQATVTDSSIVSQFLADSFPSHLLPASRESPEAPLFRARVSFFVDTWFTKAYAAVYQALRAGSAEEQKQKCEEIVKAVEKEVEPLLHDAAPFFAGSTNMTMAEVLVAPHLLRLYAFSESDLLPGSLAESLDRLGNFSKWAKLVMAQESVTSTWDKERVIQAYKEKYTRTS